MSGLEIATGVLGLLETAFSAVDRLLEANDRRKSLHSVLKSHHQELKSTKAIINVVKAEESLRTATVMAQLVELDRVAQQLNVALYSLDPGTKHASRQFFHQLFKGASDESLLTTKLGEISRSKTSLIAQIQVAAVGLQQLTGNQIVVNTEIVKRIDGRLRQFLGDGGGLKLAKAIENRTPRDDGTVLMKDADLTDLGLKDPKTSRIIVDNVTWHQATQINGPIGADKWKDISHIKIQNNSTGSFGTTINYAIEREDFYSLLAFQFIKYVLVLALLYLAITTLSNRSGR